MLVREGEESRPQYFSVLRTLSINRIRRRQLRSVDTVSMARTLSYWEPMQVQVQVPFCRSTSRPASSSSVLSRLSSPNLALPCQHVCAGLDELASAKEVGMQHGMQHGLQLAAAILDLASLACLARLAWIE